MGQRESYAPGAFSWADLATTDADAAKAFYSDLFGWELDDLDLPGGGVYTMALIDGRRVGALGTVQQEGQPPAWNAYVTVEDADATAATLVSGALRNYNDGFAVAAPPGSFAPNLGRIRRLRALPKADGVDGSRSR